MRCCRLYLLPTQISRSTSCRPTSGLSRITSATSDVLANFSRLSTSTSLVKSFFTLVEVFSQPKLKPTKIRSAKISKYRDARRRARSLGSWVLLKSIAVAWVWIAGRPLGSQPRSNAWTALRHPFVLPYAAKAKVRSNVSLQLTENIVLSTSVQVTCLCNSLRVSGGISPCNPRPVDNRRFLSKTCRKYDRLESSPLWKQMKFRSLPIR
jgi:hypothetical protein